MRILDVTNPQPEPAPDPDTILRRVAGYVGVAIAVVGIIVVAIPVAVFGLASYALVSLAPGSRPGERADV